MNSLEEEPNDLVSVVIPTRNRRVMMARTLSTVLNQSYRNIEVIIVNDGESATARIVLYFTPST